MAISQHFANRSLTVDEKQEVKQAWDNILERRQAKLRGPVELTHSRWVFLLGLLGPYMAGILAWQNLNALGKRGRAARLLVLGVGSYLAVGLGLLILMPRISAAAVTWTLTSYTFLMTSLITVAQQRDVRLGFEERAKAASPLIPTLLALVIALVQGFILRAMVGDANL